LTLPADRAAQELGELLSRALRVEHVNTLGAETHSDSDLVRVARLTSAAGGAIVAPGGRQGWLWRKGV